MYIRRNASIGWRGLVVILLLETAPIACSLELPDRSCERDEDCLKGERCTQAFCLKAQPPAMEMDMQSDREMISIDQGNVPDGRSDQTPLDMRSDQFDLDQSSTEMGAQDQMSFDHNIAGDQAAREMSLDDASSDGMAPADGASSDTAPADAAPAD
ncbi:MAG: hypothetical protein VYD19_09110, partial [Myxococcota bacterium]|nr:hypothetical protein [Myxococcota bacterium]